jgi:WD40 repeat protein
MSAGRGISIGRDAIGNVLVTGDSNEVHLTVIVADQRLAFCRTEATIGRAADSPYPGLAAFHETESSFFFGREKLITRAWVLFQALQHRPAPRIFFVVGSSGSGKSSLIRAGFVPELAREPMSGIDRFDILIMRPGVDPVARLAEVLGRISALPSTKDIDARLRGNSPDALHSIICDAFGEADRRAVLIVDQFEELFTQCVDPGLRTSFLAMAECAAAHSDKKISLVATLRSDFASSVKSPPAFATAVRESRLIVQGMDRDELRDAVLRPSGLLGHPWPAELVENLVSQAEGRAGALPLLQFALKRLWPEQVAGCLRDADWSTKLIEDFLVQAADALFEATRPASQRVVKRAFVGMVQLGEGTQDTRRIVQLSSLVAHGETPDEVRAALEPFAAPEARLISVSYQNDEPTYELTHESLITAWDRYQEWLGNTPDKSTSERIRASLRLHRRVSAAAEEWTASGKNSSLLWRGVNLDRLEMLSKVESTDLTAAELEFLLESRKAEENATRRAKWLRGLVALVAVVMTLVSTFAAWQWSVAVARQNEVTRQLNDSQLLAGFVSLQAQQWTAARETFAAVVNSPKAEPNQLFAASLGAAESLRHSRASARSVRTGLGMIEALAVSPDGNFLLAAGRTGNAPALAVLTTESLEVVQTIMGIAPNPESPHDVGFTSVDWSSKGVVIAGDSGGRVYFLEPGTFERLATTDAHTNLVRQVKFSSDGNRALSIGYDNKLLLWDVSTFSVERILIDDPDKYISATAFSPDGSWVAFNDVRAKEIVLRNLQSGEEVRREIEIDGVSSLALYVQNCCDLSVATASPYATVQIINTKDSSAGVTLGEAAPWAVSGELSPLAVSNDGLFIAYADRDNNIIIANAGSGTEQYRLGAMSTSHVNSLAMSTGGRIMTGDADGVVRLWDANDDVGVSTLPGSEGSFITGLAVDEAATRLAASSYDGSLRTWDIATLRSLSSFEDFSPLGGVTFGGDSNHLVASRWNDQLIVFDISENNVISEVDAEMFAHYSMGTGGTHSRFVTSGHGNIDVRDARTAQSLALLTGNGRAISAATLSPGGTEVIAGQEDGTLLKWRVGAPGTPVQLRAMSGEVADINSVGPTQDFVVCDRSGYIAVYDQTRSSPRLAFKGQSEAIVACQADASGRWILTGAEDGSVRLWDGSNRHQIYSFQFGLSGTANNVLVLPKEMGVAAAIHSEIIFLNFEKVRKYLREMEYTERR